MDTAASVSPWIAVPVCVIAGVQLFQFLLGVWPPRRKP